MNTSTVRLSAVTHDASVGHRPHHGNIVAIALALAAGSLPMATALGQCGGHWDTSFCPLGITGFGGGIAQTKCMQVYDDGRGPALYIGGTFEVVNGNSAPYLARWDGNAWETVPGITYVGSTNGYGVQAMTVHDDGSGPALFIGGRFGLAGVSSDYRGVAKWNGVSLVPCNTGGQLPNGLTITDLLSFQGSLLVSELPDVSTSCASGYGTILRWDGSSMSCYFDCPQAIGHGSMAMLNGALYANGLNTCGCINSNGCWLTGSVMRVTPAGGTFIGLGMPDFSPVYASNNRDLLAWQGKLYFTGQLNTHPGRAPIVWNGGTSWSPAAGGLDLAGGNEVWALDTFPDDSCTEALYAIGPFTNSNGNPNGKGIARLVNGAWTPVGTGVEFGGSSGPLSKFDLESFSDNSGRALYVGSVSMAGGSPAKGIARWLIPWCIADFDHDGFVNGEDFDAYVAVFEAGSISADANHDGFVTGEDFDLFAEHFGAGC